MKTKTLMALAVGAALALPFSALAQNASAGASAGADSPRTQEGRDANSATFKHLDVNNDGHISQEEMKAAGQHGQDFARLDKDRDVPPGEPRQRVWLEQRGTPGLLSYQEFSELNVGSASVGGSAGGAASGASGGAGTPAPR